MSLDTSGGSGGGSVGLAAFLVTPAYIIYKPPREATVTAGDKITAENMGREAPKSTTGTNAFKLMLASWLVTLAVAYLNKRGWLVPDFMQGEAKELAATGIDLAFVFISGWITRLVAGHSLERNMARVELEHALIKANAGVQESNVNADVTMKG
jgi:hypothetical protein